MLNEPQSILVIDHNSDSGVLLVRTLARKFPTTVIQICGDAAAASKAVASTRHDAIILHRTEELNCVEMLHLLRKLDTTVPILAVSGIDRTSETIAAGANAFLSYEEWLRVGVVVKELLDRRRQELRDAFKGSRVSEPDSIPPFSLTNRAAGDSPKVSGMDANNPAR